MLIPLRGAFLIRPIFYLFICEDLHYELQLIRFSLKLFSVAKFEDARSWGACQIHRHHLFDSPLASHNYLYIYNLYVCQHGK
jgi:hypothetical protein